VRFAPVTDAAAHLEALLECYRTGLVRPLPFFPDSSFEFARRKLQPSLREKSDPLSAARTRWFGGEFQKPRAEKEDPWLNLCFGDCADPLDPQWQEIALRIYGPLLASRSELNADESS
jgi:exodeoxyribonuclease V gamma subunit